MKIESVNTITSQIQVFFNKYVNIKCYICYNQDIQVLYHVPTEEERGHPGHLYTSGISFDYKNISNCSHSELLKINLDRTIVIVSGILGPINKEETYPCSCKMFVEKVEIY